MTGVVVLSPSYHIAEPIFWITKKHNHIHIIQWSMMMGCLNPKCWFSNLY